MTNQTPFWACLIIANIHLANDKPITGIMWTGLAVFAYTYITFKD